MARDSQAILVPLRISKFEFSNLNRETAPAAVIATVIATVIGLIKLFD